MNLSAILLSYGKIYTSLDYIVTKYGMSERAYLVNNRFMVVAFLIFATLTFKSLTFLFFLQYSGTIILIELKFFLFDLLFEIA